LDRLALTPLAEGLEPMYVDILPVQPEMVR